MVDVEQGALGALEQDAVAGVQPLVGEPGRVGDQPLQPMAVVHVLLGHRLQVEARILGERA